MSLSPADIAALQDIAADLRALNRKVEAMIRQADGTAVEQECAKCQGRGVQQVVDGGYYVSAPCDCPAGKSFRDAAVRNRKRYGDLPTARHLSHGETHAKGEAGREKKLGRDE